MTQFRPYAPDDRKIHKPLGWRQETSSACQEASVFTGDPSNAKNCTRAQEDVECGRIDTIRYSLKMAAVKMWPDALML